MPPLPTTLGRCTFRVVLLPFQRPLQRQPRSSVNALARARPCPCPCPPQTRSLDAQHNTRPCACACEGVTRGEMQHRDARKSHTATRPRPKDRRSSNERVEKCQALSMHRPRARALPSQPWVGLQPLFPADPMCPPPRPTPSVTSLSPALLPIPIPKPMPMPMPIHAHLDSHSRPPPNRTAVRMRCDGRRAGSSHTRAGRVSEKARAGWGSAQHLKHSATGRWPAWRLAASPPDPDRRRGRL